jgi:hypothetical protein
MAGGGGDFVDQWHHQMKLNSVIEVMINPNTPEKIRTRSAPSTQARALAGVLYSAAA